MADLSPKQRQHLKGLAHHLDPVVHIGKDGLSENVRRQIDTALDRHELIKVKLAESAPLDRDAASEQLPVSVGAFLVQNVGRVFVLYRPHPEKPRIELPWPLEEDEVSDDLEEARAPRPRAPGSLLGSVRDRGAATSIQPLTPPPRPTFAKDERQTPAPAKRETPKGFAKPKRTGRPRRNNRRGKGRPR